MAWIRQLISKYRRLITYALVGGVNTGVDVVVFTLLHTLSPLSEGGCQAISYSAGVACSFVLNRGITFRDGANTGLALQVIRFLAVNAVSLLTGVVGINFLVGLGLHAAPAKAAVTVVTAGINYFGYKLLVFRVEGR